MNPLKLLDPNYLFDPTPGQSFLFFWPMMVFFILLFASSWYAKKQIHSMPNAKVAAEFLGRVPTRIREFAIAGMFLTFFRDQDIPWFGMRFATILLFALMLFYAYSIHKKYKEGISARISHVQQKKIVDKYLPKPKKRK